MGLTDELARFGAAPVKLSDETVRHALHCVIDWTGVALAGATRPESKQLLDVFAGGPLHTALAPTAGATVLASRQRLPLLDAVLVNGFSGHVLDFDDSQLELEGHSSAPTLPALFALAERQGASGLGVLEALVVGVTLAARLSTVVNPEHYAAGWHATGTLGTFAAAAACGRLLHLDAEQHARVIGLASMQAAGLKSAFGSMAKPLQVGKASANGLLSALLAERGVTSPSDSIEVEQGFAMLHAGEVPLRRPLELDPSAAMRGMIFKYHASCHATHPALEAFAALLAKERALSTDRIETVRVRVGPSVLLICNIERPVTGLQLKFSIRGTLAMAMAGCDTGDPESYSDETARRAEVLAAEEKVRIEIDPLLNYWQSEVDLLMTDGSHLLASADIGEPCEDAIVQQDRLEEKFERLVVPVLGERRMGKLLEALTKLTELGDVGEMLQLCVPPGS